jgi:hypothetical protein
MWSTIQVITDLNTASLYVVAMPIARQRRIACETADVDTP